MIFGTFVQMIRYIPLEVLRYFWRSEKETCITQSRMESEFLTYTTPRRQRYGMTVELFALKNTFGL